MAHKDDTQIRPEEGLTDSERAQMRGNIAYFISTHPAQAPLFIRVRSSLVMMISQSAAVFSARPVGFALALMLVIGIGTSYAAEGALPGEPLYAVKVRLNEPLRETIAVSDAARAEWHSEQIARRLTEAEALAAKGRLDAHTEAAVSAQLTEAARKFDASVHALSKSDDPRLAKAEARLETSVRGHERTLAALTGAPIRDVARETAPIAPVRAMDVAPAEVTMAMVVTEEPPVVEVALTLTATATATTTASTTGEQAEIRTGPAFKVFRAAIERAEAALEVQVGE